MNNAYQSLLPKFIPIDLSRGERSDHPDITEYGAYLVKYRGRYHAGKFVRTWYGWSFEGSPNAPAGLQFNAPGYNQSEWEAVWCIEDDRDPSQAEIMHECLTAQLKRAAYQIGWEQMTDIQKDGVISIMRFSPVDAAKIYRGLNVARDTKAVANDQWLLFTIKALYDMDKVEETRDIVVDTMPLHRRY